MVRKFGFGGEDVAGDIREKYGYDGPLLELFAGNEGGVVHKWHHYIPLYDRYFGKYRDRPVKFLEIGVSEGGSLAMWRRYFGGEAVIFGIDLNPRCAALDGQAGQVRIGSQTDREFLRRVVEEMGGVDVVLDDGSHQMRHVRKTLVTLFPLLNPGGTYMIEDLHTAYMERYDGGFGAPRNFFNFLRGCFDDMHRWYHDEPLQRPGLKAAFDGIHVHDSMVVFDKGPVHRPVHSQVGKRRER